MRKLAEQRVSCLGKDVSDSTAASRWKDCVALHVADNATYCQARIC